jgi:transposase
MVVAAVLWTRHEARFTRAFEDKAAWLATRSAQSTVATLLRVTWRSVARSSTRVVAAAKAGRDPFATWSGATVVAERCPQAIQCTDPFHVVGWATDALDEVRRQVWNAARRAGADETAHASNGRAGHAGTIPRT